MEIKIFLMIVWIHCISDFWLQSDYIANNKSKYIECLLTHCGIYSIPFLIFGFEYALINGVLHFIVDYFSSALTSHFHVRGQRHWFFVAIGVDQAIHMTCLILTAGYIRLMF